MSTGVGWLSPANTTPCSVKWSMFPKNEKRLMPSMPYIFQHARNGTKLDFSKRSRRPDYEDISQLTVPRRVPEIWVCEVSTNHIAFMHTWSCRICFNVICWNFINSHLWNPMWHSHVWYIVVIRTTRSFRKIKFGLSPHVLNFIGHPPMGNWH